MNYDSLVAGMWRLVKRRWYIFAGALVLGVVAAHVLSGDSSYSAEQSVQIGSIEDAGALLDAGAVPEVNVQRIAQQAQLDFEQSELDDTITATYSSNTTARTVTLRLSGPSEDAVSTALLELNGRFDTIARGPLLSQIEAGITNADSRIDALEARADDTIEQIDNSSLDDTTLAVLISELSATRTEITDANERKSVLEGLRTYVNDSFVVFGSSDSTSPARGVLVYAAGAIGAGALATLAAAGWVLVDRRVRRLVHLERAAPGVPILGFVERSNGNATLDASVRAALRTFVSEHGLGRLTVFGAGANSSVDPVGSAIRECVDVPVEVSSSPAADAISLDGDAPVGYVAVTRWGSTTEDQVSAAVGDISRAGNAPVGLLLVGIPGRDRNWVAAGSQLAG